MHIHPLLVLLGLAIFVQDAWPRTVWAKDQVDLSVGAAIPSVNGSIRENPAGLTQFQGKIFDLSTLFNSGGEPIFLGSFASNLNSFGYGLSVEKNRSDFIFLGGFSASMGTLSLGVNSTFSTATSSPSFDVGLIQDFKKVKFALVFRDLSNFGKDWTIGFGFNPNQWFRFGFDFNFQSNPAVVGITDAHVLGVMEVFTTQKYAVRVSYGVGIVPALVMSDPALGVGLNYWFSKKASLYGIYKDYTLMHTYSMGMKFLL